MNTNKRKIVQLISSINLGGAENIAFNIGEHCKIEDSKVTEFIIVELYQSSTNYSNAKKKELIAKNIKTFCLFKGRSKRLSLIFGPISLLWFIKRENPSCIHSHTDLPDLVLASTIRLMRLFRMDIPRIIRTIHNTELWPKYPCIAKYTESAFQNDIIIGVSKVALEAYFKMRKKNNLCISSQNKVIYNGCDLPIYSSIEIPFAPNKISVAFCGRFEHQKGIDILINWLDRINHTYKNYFDFYFIGDGRYKRELNIVANNYDNIFIYDSIPLISNKLHNFDFVLMPSRFEGLPLISIESSFSRVPVIASRAPGLDETLPQSWPLIFDLNNEEELLNIFKKIIDKEFDIHQIKEKAFNFVSNHFIIDNMIKEYNKIYSDF